MVGFGVNCSLGRSLGFTLVWGAATLALLNQLEMTRGRRLMSQRTKSDEGAVPPVKPPVKEVAAARAPSSATVSIVT